jgi:cell division protein FtsQ
MAFFTSLLAALLLSMLLIGVGLWVVRHPVWTLSSIELHGDVKHQNPERFRAYLVSQLRGNFLTLDLKQVQTVAQSVPWVRKAVIKRVFPNRLLVTLEEHEAFAWWQTADGSALINTQGEIFETLDTGDEPDDLPELAGPETQVSQIKQVYERIQPWFLRLGLPIWRLELAAQGGWQVILSNGAVIELGRGNHAELESRVQRFVSSLPKVMEQHGRGLEGADLRYPQAYAVRLKGVGTMQQTFKRP